MFQLILFLFLFVDQIQCTSGFASFFVENSIFCWTYLAQDEIVMNHPILPLSSSRYPDDIFIQVLDMDTRDVITPENGSSGIALNYEEEEEVARFLITLEYPKTMALADLQYVVETSEGGTFISAMNKGGVGCDGRRAFGRRKTEIVFEIERSAVMGMEKKEDNDKKQGVVEVWAGWATEHEAVTLSPPVTFYYKNSSMNEKGGQTGGSSSQGMDDVDVELSMDEKLLVEQIARDSSLSLSDKARKLNLKMDELQEKQKILAMEKMQQMRNTVVMKHDHERIKRLQIGLSPNDIENLSKDQKVPNHSIKSVSSTTSSFRELYEQSEFGSKTFSLYHFFQACLFLLMSVLAILGIAKERKPSKGRRDL